MSIRNVVLNLRQQEYLLAVGAASVRTIFCAYRGATQSITHDEAFSALQFISTPIATWAEFYDANNHVLNSLLSKVVVAILGDSEFSLRLPTILAGFAFSVGIFSVLMPLRSASIRWVAFVGILLHPLLLDFSVAARGYCLELACLVWSIVLGLRGRYLACGVVLGFGVSANLTAIFPGIALALGLGAIRRDVRGVVVCLLGAVSVSLLVCYYPMSGARQTNFYVGFSTIGESVYNLLLLTFRTNFESAGLIGNVGAVKFAQLFVLPLLCASMVAALFRTVQESHRIVLTVLLISLAILGTAHTAFGIPYPVDRTGLWLITLFGVAWAYAADADPFPAVRRAYGVAAVLLCIQFATQIQSRYFIIWSFDSETKQVIKTLTDLPLPSAPRKIRVSCSVSQQPALEYYRRRLGLESVEPVRRVNRAGLTGYDFYLLTYPEILDPSARRLRAIIDNRELGILFAREP